MDTKNPFKQPKWTHCKNCGAPLPPYLPETAVQCYPCWSADIGRTYGKPISKGQFALCAIIIGAAVIFVLCVAIWSMSHGN